MLVGGFQTGADGRHGAGWRRLLAAFFVAAATASACGEQAATKFDGIVAVALVLERRADGTVVPIPNAEITLSLHSPSNVSGDTVLLQEFTHKTDAHGLWAGLRSPEGKTDAEISTLFVDVELADGRTGFGRQKLDTRFAFETWFKENAPSLANADAMVARICSAASDYPDCQTILKSRKLTTWGVAVVVTIR